VNGFNVVSQRFIAIFSKVGIRSAGLVHPQAVYDVPTHRSTMTQINLIHYPVTGLALALKW